MPIFPRIGPPAIAAEALRVEESHMPLVWWHAARMPYEQVKPGELLLRDVLAKDRTVLANERTLLAYLRTGLMLVVSGVSLRELIRPALPVYLAIALALGVAGIVIAAVGVWRYLRLRRQLRTLDQR